MELPSGTHRAASLDSGDRNCPGREKPLRDPSLASSFRMTLLADAVVLAATQRVLKLSVAMPKSAPFVPGILGARTPVRNLCSPMSRLAIVGPRTGAVPLGKHRSTEVAMSAKILFLLTIVLGGHLHAAVLTLSWTNYDDVRGFELYSLDLETAGAGAVASTQPLPESARDTRAIDGGSIYYAARTGTETHIRSRELASGVERELFTFPSQPSLWNFIVTDSHLYLGDSLNDDIWRVDLDGSNAQVVFDSPVAVPSPTYVAVVGADLFWIEGDVNRNIGSIVGASADGSSAPETLADGFESPRFLNATSTYLFWYDPAGGSNDRSIYRSELDGTRTRKIMPGVSIRRLVADETHLYWTRQDSIMRSDHDGNNIELVYQGDDIPFASFYLHSIPEPTTSLLMLAGSLLVFGRRSRAARGAD